MTGLIKRPFLYESVLSNSILVKCEPLQKYPFQVGINLHCESLVIVFVWILVKSLGLNGINWTG